MLEKAARSHERAYNVRFSTKEPTIRDDMLVYTRRLQPRSDKLEPKYMGPFRVTKVLPDAVVIKSLYSHKSYTVHLSYIVPSFQVEDNDARIYPTPEDEREMSALNK